MRAVLSVIVVLAILAFGIVIGAYGPRIANYGRHGVTPNTAVPAPPTMIQIDPDAARDRQEMLRTLRLIQQELASLRATTSQVVTLCSRAMAESRSARADDMDNVASGMDEIRQRLDSAQLGRDLAEIERHRRALDAEVDTTLRRFTDRARQ